MIKVVKDDKNNKVWRNNVQNEGAIPQFNATRLTHDKFVNSDKKFGTMKTLKNNFNVLLDFLIKLTSSGNFFSQQSNRKITIPINLILIQNSTSRQRQY